MRYKDWAVIEYEKSGKTWARTIHYLPDHPEHDGTCNDEIPGLTCIMCNVSLPDDVFNFLTVAYHLYKWE